MKKRLLALSVASALTVGAGTVGAFEIAANGIGMYNLLPYYTVQAGNATLIQITNTDTENGKAVKVRFRGAEWSDDVFDFTLFLSPGDVWTGAVSANGLRAAMRTVDNSCTLPADVNRDFITSRLEASDSADAGTREGYIEVITMADIPEVDFDETDPSTHLYTAIKHVDGEPPCNGELNGSGITGVLNGLQPDHPWEGVNPDQGMVNPTGSLMAYAININVPTSKAFVNEAIALNPNGNPAGATNKIFFRQSNQPLPASGEWTADRIFFPVGCADPVNPSEALGINAADCGTGLTMFQFDMPDLTTPIDEAGAYPNAFAQRDAVTLALTRPNAVVEYVTDTAIQATSDVVFNQPTRRFYYTYDDTCSGGTVPDDCDYDINNEDVDIYGYDTYELMDGEENLIPVGPPDFWDREEDRFTEVSDIVISPTPPIELVPFFLRGEVSVVSINNGTLPTGSLSASLTAFNYQSPLTGPDGWVALSTSADPGSPEDPTDDVALPVIGFTAIKIFNGGVGSAGTNYGLALPLRTPETP